MLDFDAFFEGVINSELKEMKSVNREAKCFLQAFEISTMFFSFFGFQGEVWGGIYDAAD